MSNIYFVLLLVLSDARTPLLTDCFELYFNGFVTGGVYEIDPTGQRDSKNAIIVYCNMGWTFLLNRGQYGNSQVTNLSRASILYLK